MHFFIHDYRANKGNIKSLIIVLSFRVSSFFARRPIFLRFLGFPVRVLYRVLIEWLLGVEIPDTIQIGKGLKVFHGQGLVVHKNTIIGEHVILRHNTTIGTKKGSVRAPVIGNNVDIGANTVILGPINIGENVVIGAGAVVVQSFPGNCIIAGNPAKIIKNI